MLCAGQLSQQLRCQLTADLCFIIFQISSGVHHNVASWNGCFVALECFHQCWDSQYSADSPWRFRSSYVFQYFIHYKLAPLFVNETSVNGTIVAVDSNEGFRTTWTDSLTLASQCPNLLLNALNLFVNLG